MTEPTKADITAALEHGLWLVSLAEPLRGSDRMLADLAHGFEQLTAELHRVRSERDKLSSESGSWVTGMKCLECNGTGEDDEARSCPCCGGTGDVWMTWKDQAFALQSQVNAHKDTLEMVCTGGRLTCDDCQQTMPCMCGHKK